MTRRTFDVLVPIAYAVAIVVAFIIGDEAGVGGVATLGLLFVVAYYAALRQNIKA